MTDGNYQDTTINPGKNSRKPVTEDWRVPIIALGYFPSAIFLLWLADFSDNEINNIPWIVIAILAYTAVVMILLLLLILPLYATYLIRLTRQRLEKGDKNIALTIFHLSSFIVPLSGLLLFWLFASAQGA